MEPESQTTFPLRDFHRTREHRLTIRIWNLLAFLWCIASEDIRFCGTISNLLWWKRIARVASNAVSMSIRRGGGNLRILLRCCRSRLRRGLQGARPILSPNFEENEDLRTWQSTTQVQFGLTRSTFIVPLVSVSTCEVQCVRSNAASVS